MPHQVQATVHVLAASGDADERPEASRVQLAADSLREMGFNVLRAGRFGVSVQADAQRFEAELGITPDVAAASGVTATPRDPTLKNLIDYVDVLPPADLAR